MASVKEKTYWDYLYTGKDYLMYGITQTTKGVYYMSKTIIIGVSGATTLLVMASAVIQTIAHPVTTMGFVLEITKGTFTTVLGGLGIIAAPDQVMSPTVASVAIISIAFASIGFVLAHKIFDKFFTEYEPIRIPIPESKAIPFDIIKDTPELANNAASLQYLLLAIVIILSTMLYIQIVNAIRDEINLYRDNPSSIRLYRLIRVYKLTKSVKVKRVYIVLGKLY